MRYTIFFLSLFYSFIFSSLSAAYGARNEDVKYRNCKWDATNKVVVVEEDTKKCILIEGQNNEWQGLGEKGVATYYAVKGNVKRKTLNCFGEVHLIICDGATLTCTGGIKAEKKNAAEIYIHAQSEGDNRGNLVVSNSYKGAAGIGAATDQMAGDIIIQGGNITVTGGEYAAAIGGGMVQYSEDGGASDILIYGGKVTATGSYKTAGIGTGAAWSSKECTSPALYVYGGEVTATGGDMGAGVGGGGGLNISGAWGVRAGLSGAKVFVYGGSLTAKGGNRAAGIGSGSTNTNKSGKRNGGILRVYGGKVTATGGDYGAGIGGGCNAEGADVEISGGIVWAKGGKNSAGIGGGEDGLPGSCNIIAGKVTAIIGENCIGRNAGKGSAIGFGRGADKNYKAENLKIGDILSVTAGDGENNIERTFTAPERVDACQWRNYALIDTCAHKDATYTIINGEKHRRKCTYCTANKDEAHDFGPNGNHHDCACGQKFDSETTVLTVTRHYPEITQSDYKTITVTDKVARNQKYIVSAPPAISGMHFEGYSTKEADSDEMTDDEAGTLVKEGEMFLTDNINYYARYRFEYNTEWTWNDDYSAATVKISTPARGGSETLNATCEIVEDQKPTDTQIGRRTYKATATYKEKENITYTFTDEQVVEYFNIAALTLDADEDNNEETIEKYTDRNANVTIQNMTLQKDGKLHPLCLPFSVKIAGSPLEGATIYSCVDETIAGEQLQLTFKPVTYEWVMAGEPYFVKWPQGTNIGNPTFTDVYVGDSPMSVEGQYYAFGGTFDRAFFDSEEKVFTIENDALVPLKDNIVGSFANYLYIPREKTAGGDIAVTSVRLNFEGDVTLEKSLYDTWDGEGTAESPYTIYTKGQLQQMSNAFNNNASSVAGKYFRQAANIVFDKTVENNLAPVNEFTGHYDGAGYTISGLNINNPDGNEAALFKVMEEGSTVKNVIIRNSTFRSNSAAAIAYYVRHASGVENCHVLNDVTVEGLYYSAGGVVGNVQTTSKVSQCTSLAAVKGGDNAGGIVGHISSGTIDNCIYLGNNVTSSKNAHAIAGYCYPAESTIKDSYFTEATLNDEYAKLMPMTREDNATFLHLLYSRDGFLLNVNSGLTEEQIGYDLALNGREYKAVKNADDTWSRRAFSLCLPFDMAIPEELHEDVLVYQLHEIDLDKKEFIFTNDFPILKAGWAYILVVNKGSITFSAKNVLVKETPDKPETVRVAGGSKELGYWRGTFKTLDNERLVEEKAYIMQSNGTYRHIDKIYSTKPKVERYLAYFSAIEPIGTSFKMKFVRTENGEETGDVTDFPADEFYSEYDIDEPTGVREVQGGSRFKVHDDKIYNLSGQRVGEGYKGIIIKNGRKLIIDN